MLNLVQGDTHAACPMIIAHVSTSNFPDPSILTRLLTQLGLRPHWHPTQGMGPPELRSDCPICGSAGSLFLCGCGELRCRNRGCSVQDSSATIIGIRRSPDDS